MKKGFRFMSEYADEEYGWEPVPHVCVEGEWIPMDKVDFLNIEEDISGRDLVTFEYMGKDYRSFVTMK